MTITKDDLAKLLDYMPNVYDEVVCFASAFDAGDEHPTRFVCDTEHWCAYELPENRMTIRISKKFGLVVASREDETGFPLSTVAWKEMVEAALSVSRAAEVVRKSQDRETVPFDAEFAMLRTYKISRPDTAVLERNAVFMRRAREDWVRCLDRLNRWVKRMLWADVPPSVGTSSPATTEEVPQPLTSTVTVSMAALNRARSNAHHALALLDNPVLSHEKRAVLHSALESVVEALDDRLTEVPPVLDDAESTTGGPLPREVATEAANWVLVRVNRVLVERYRDARRRGDTVKAGPEFFDDALHVVHDVTSAAIETSAAIDLANAVLDGKKE